MAPEHDGQESGFTYQLCDLPELKWLPLCVYIWLKQIIHINYPDQDLAQSSFVVMSKKINNGDDDDDDDVSIVATTLLKTFRKMAP